MMSTLTKAGLAKAHCGGKNYVTVGAVFRDEDNKLVIKIDSLPLPNSGWTGWINVFDSGNKAKAEFRAKTVSERPRPGQIPFSDLDDDIPF